MKKYIIAIILIALLIPGGVIMASTITNASFHGTVRATNNSTAASCVSAPFTANTTAWINSGILNSTATNIVARDDAGDDTAIMPGWGSNPWLVFYDSIMANSNRNIAIYTGNVSGGKIAYFPDTNGMAVTDNVNLECSNNFSIETTAFINAAQTGYLFNKPSAVSCNISASGNLTAAILTAGGYINPSGFVDSASKWTNEAAAYDDNTGSYTNSASYTDDWTDFLELTVTPLFCDAIRFWTLKSASRTQVDIDAYYDSAWHDVYEGTDFNNNNWTEKDLDDIHYVSSMRFRQYCVGAESGILYEVDFSQSTVAKRVSTSITSDEYAIKVYADGTDLMLDIDGVNIDTVSLGAAAVPDNANAWQFGSASTTPYLITANVTINGVYISGWEWEYGTIFSDLGGNGNYATPTFRTTSSDADVSASLISFLPISEAKSDTDPSTDWPEMITEVPEEPGTAYSENETPGIFFAGAVNNILSHTDVPTSFFWYSFTFIIIISAGLLIFYAFSSKGQNALMIKIITMGAIMIFWALPGPNVYGMFVPIYFGMWCFGVIVLSRSYGW